MLPARGRVFLAEQCRELVCWRKYRVGQPRTIVTSMASSRTSGPSFFGQRKPRPERGLLDGASDVTHAP
jgi:hypothetical protein